MFGWELPPHNSGGLGTACLGLTQELAPLGVDLDFVLPQLFAGGNVDHMNLVSAKEFADPAEIKRLLNLTDDDLIQISQSLGYGNHLQFDEHGKLKVTYQNGYSLPPAIQARWYAYQANLIAKKRDFDLVHCHEWMTYDSGIAAREVAKKEGREVPLVAQVHATEIDRSAGKANASILEIERRGLHAADRVVAVSHYTKEIIKKQYQVPGSKIEVIHNGISSETPTQFAPSPLKKHYKLVLFMGRITLSKGPEYFLKLAKAVTDRDDSVKFMMIGDGDQQQACMEAAARMGLTGKVLFNSFIRGDEVNRAYQMADLFVMPSVSEPFGLVALEAIKNGTPAIVSKQSGVSEVSKNLVTVNFWDIKAMEKAVFELLYSPEKASTLSAASRADLSNLSWKQSAQQLRSMYHDLLTPSPILRIGYA